MTRRPGALVGLAAGLLSLIGGLWVAGPGPLATPPVGSWEAMSTWCTALGPDGVAVAGVRLVALLLATWLLLATVLQLVGSIPWFAPVRVAADLISPRSLQRLGQGLAGLSLTAGLAAPAPSVGTPAEVVAPTTAAGWTAEDPPLPPAPPAAPAWPSQGTATMRVVDPSPVQAEPIPVADAVTVAPGDSLWSLAADELDARGGARPGEREVARYWRQVVAANRAALVDPSNPDLIYPGQVVTLPAVG